MKILLAFFTLVLAVPSLYALEVGSQAPEFSLPDVRSGKVTSLKEVAGGKPAAVIFVATGCPYSNAFNAVMNDLSRKFSAQGVVFLGINSNKTELAAEVRNHAEQNGFVFPVLKDEGNAVADQYAASVTPEVFLIDAKGTVVYHGALGNSRQPTTKAEEANGAELTVALEQLLSGQAVAPVKTKMFGCTIKR